MRCSKKDAKKYLRERFGVTILPEEKFFIRSDSAWLTTGDLEKIDIETPGVRAVRFNKFVKPTTYIIQYFGDRIEKSKVEVNRSELLRMLGGEIVGTDEQMEEGYASIVYEGRHLGCGLYKDQAVSSRIPKHKAQELKSIV